MRKEDPTFLDPDEFALNHMTQIKTQIIKGLDFREDTLKTLNDSASNWKLEELRQIRKFIKALMYKKGSWKDFS